MSFLPDAIDFVGSDYCLFILPVNPFFPFYPSHQVVVMPHDKDIVQGFAEIQRIVKDPLYVEIKRHNPASARVTGSSVVEDLMIHDIDIILNFVNLQALKTGFYLMYARTTIL